MYYVDNLFILFFFAGKIVPFLESVVTLSSVLTILAITWDRYKGICYPLQYSEDKSKKMVSPFIFIWSVSILASIPLFFVAIFRDSHFRDGTPIKVCRMPITHTWHLLYFISIFTVFFCVMFFVMLYFTLKIFRTLAHRRMFINQSADRYAKKILHERRQMIRLMVVVVIMFFVCLVPQRAISLWLIFASKIDIMSLKLEGYLLLKTFPRVLVYMNSAINPIIYNFTSTKFKNAFKNVLSCRQKLYKSVKQRMKGRLNLDVTELTGVLEWKSGLQ
jgi:neuromedin U receptor 2